MLNTIFDKEMGQAPTQKTNFYSERQAVFAFDEEKVSKHSFRTPAVSSRKFQLKREAHNPDQK